MDLNLVLLTLVCFLAGFLVLMIWLDDGTAKICLWESSSVLIGYSGKQCIFEPIVRVCSFYTLSSFLEFTQSCA